MLDYHIMNPTYLKKDHFDDEVLPSNLNVSTISLTMQLNTNVILSNISKYMKIAENSICSIDFEGKKRTILEKKKARKRKSDNFYNSITMEIMVRANKVINFKIFKNGGVQIAGCKNIHEGNNAINILVKELSSTIGLEVEEPVDQDSGTIPHKSIKEVSFIDKQIDVDNLKINLINVNFKLDFELNREILYQILLNENIECYYEKCKHAGVCIKFTPPEKEKPISIFIFESGSVVITGSKNEKHIMSGYKYIMDLLLKHKKRITKISPKDFDKLKSKYGKYMTSMK